MKNSAETEKSTNEEIIDQLVKKVSELEKREIVFPEINIPDYSEQFTTLEKLIKDTVPDYDTPVKELKTAVNQHNLEYPAVQIQNQINALKNKVAQLPKLIPVHHHHHFDAKTKGWIIAGMILLIVAAITSGLSVHLWVENDRLQENDIKFRMIRQVYPIHANWADKSYADNPKGMENKTKQLENEALERSEAIDLAMQKEMEAKTAREKLIKLKKHH